MISISRKPPIVGINWGNPLTEGLVFSQPIISPNPNVDELVSKTRTAITNPIAGNYVRTPGGLMLKADGAASGGQYIATPLLARARSCTRQTHCFFLYRNGDGAGSSTNSFLRESDLTNAGYNITDNSAVSSFIVASAPWSTTNGNWRFPLPSNNVLYFYVVTYDSSSTSNVPNVYQNGVKQTNTLATQPVGTQTFSDTHLITMNIYQSGNIGTRTLNGSISNICKWNRVLREPEILKLTANPWQIYQFPQKIYANSVSSGGGGGPTSARTGTFRDMEQQFYQAYVTAQRTTEDRKSTYFASQVGGRTKDAERNYLRSLGAVGKDLGELWNSYLNNRGLTGTRRDKLRQFYQGYSFSTESAFTATGGTITESGGYKIHTFTSSGTFEITSGSKDVEYLVVAGGGGGAAGGGGGGGVKTGTKTSLGTGTYTVTVGNGGNAGVGYQGSTQPTNGDNSVFSDITSTGGGKGGVNFGDSTLVAGGNGGSGGGAAYSGSGVQTAGNGTAGQGNNGGVNTTGSPFPAGGGGGAGAVGGNGSGSTGGNGGNGTASSISGSSVTYGGGGGGGVYGSFSGGTGGSGGGGNGSNGLGNGENGTANTGGGGGGASNGGTGGNGGSGIVIVRYAL